MSCKLVYLARRAKTVSREDWPRIWKSHAIFASQFPALEAEIDWMRYCNRIDEPMLDGQPAVLPGISTVHDGVSVASSESLETLQGGALSKEERALIDKDEVRVFDMLTPNFTWYCNETVVMDGPPLEFAVFRFLKRKDGVGRQDFDRQFIAAHEGISPPAGLNRLALNHPMGDPLPLFPFEGIAEWWFATQDDAVRALSGDMPGGDLAGFCDADATETVLTYISHRWPKN